MGTKKKVVLIIPFFGALPHYFTLFLRSAGKNPSFDFYFFTDFYFANKIPSNCRHFLISRKEFLDDVNKILNLNIADLPGHKICDFRPFFGLIFKKFLNDADFWGYCDVDLVFGNLNTFINEDDLNFYDFIGAHSKQFVGHFTLVKNSEEINKLCFKIPNWRELCLEKDARHLDEERFSDVVLKEAKFKWKKPNDLFKEVRAEKCSHVITYTFRGKVADYHNREFILTQFDGDGLFIKLEKDIRVPLIYVHFMGIKNWWHWPKSFSVDSKSISFSRIGAFYVKNTRNLLEPKYLCIYWYQCFLYYSKFFFGKFFKVLFPYSLNKKLKKFFKV